MFLQLFEILDVPLVCIFTILAVLGVFVLKNIYNIFLSLFISIFLLIFLSSIILIQQIYLGEFLIISTFFILVVVFFIFNLNGDFDNLYLDNTTKKSNFGLVFVGLLLTLIFALILVNFNIIVSDNIDFTIQTTTDTNLVKPLDKKNQVIYSNYLEGISLLNQNRVFQRLTHLVMFYTCAVIVLYFFNKKGDTDER